MIRSTSAIAYHQHEARQRQYMSVAEAIMRRQQLGLPVFIARIAEDCGLKEHIVSARLHDLRKTGVIIDGAMYKLQESGRTKNPASGRTVIDWKLIISR